MLLIKPFIIAHLTFLISQKTGLVTVYDVARSDDNLLHINFPPYSLPPTPGFTVPRGGYSFFRHPSDHSYTDVSLFHLSERGHIDRLDLHVPRDGHTSAIVEASSQLEWSNDVKMLNMQSANLRADFGTLGSREFLQVDFSPSYKSERV